MYQNEKTTTSKKHCRGTTVLSYILEKTLEMEHKIKEKVTVLSKSQNTCVDNVKIYSIQETEALAIIAAINKCYKKEEKFSIDNQTL